MKQNRLGRTELRVSELGFGAWAIGGTGPGFNYGEVSQTDAIAAVESFLAAGGTHIDTARYYNESERILGRVLAGADRSSVFLASKTFHNDRDGILSDLETSLSLLETDHLELYYLHQPPEDEPTMDGALAVMEDLRLQGVIASIGASIKGPNVTGETVGLTHRYIADGRVDAIQIIYSIFRQQMRAVFSAAESAGVTLVGRTALESGFLTGKYRPGHVFAPPDHRHRWSRQRLDAILECVQELAATSVPRSYESLAEVAIRFAMHPNAITTTIVGAKSKEQMTTNLQALQRPALPCSLVEQLAQQFGDRTGEFNGDGG